MGVEEYNKQQLERLREHKIAFDQEAMWAAMQKKKKRRGAFIFFTMALVALAIVFLTFSLYSNFEAEDPKENLHSQKVIIENTDIPVQEFAKNNTVEPAIENNENDPENTHFSKEISTTSDNYSSHIKSKSETRKEIKQRVESVYNSNNTNSSPNISNTTSSRNVSSGFINNSNRQSSNSDKGEYNLNPKVNEKSLSDKNNLDDESEILIEIKKLTPFQFPFLESLIDRSADFEDLEVDAEPPIVEIIDNTKSRLSIGAYGGLGYLYRQITLDTETITLEDQTLEEISIGLELKYQLRPDIFIRSGLEYWQATDRRESLSYTITNLQDLEDPTSLGIEEDDRGLIVQTSFSRKHTIYQSYNVPLILGWNTNNDKWNAFVEGGLLYNFRVNSMRELPFETSEVYVIGSRNQISPLAGIGVSYSPSSNLEIFGRANWRASQHVTNSASLTNQHYGAIRGQIGIRIGI